MTAPNTKRIAELARKTLWRINEDEHWNVEETSLSDAQRNELQVLADAMGLTLDAVEILLAMALDVEGELLPGETSDQIDEVTFSVTPPFADMVSVYCSESTSLSGEDYRLLLRECFKETYSFEEITRRALVAYARGLEVKA